MSKGIEGAVEGLEKLSRSDDGECFLLLLDTELTV